jgi:hypothetical protein
LAVGNAYDAESVAGQYDAMTGLVLKGNGKGTFKPILFPQSGFLADGDCKYIAGLNSPANRMFVVSANKGMLRVFRPQKK